MKNLYNKGIACGTREGAETWEEDWRLRTSVDPHQPATQWVTPPLRTSASLTALQMGECMADARSILMAKPMIRDKICLETWPVTLAMYWPPYLLAHRASGYSSTHCVKSPTTRCLTTMEMFCLTVLRARRLKSPPWGLWESICSCLSPSFWRLPEILGDRWLVIAPVSASVFTWHSFLSSCLFRSSCKDTCHAAWRTHPTPGWPHLNSSQLQGPCWWVKSHLEVWRWMRIWGRDYPNPYTHLQ